MRQIHMEDSLKRSPEIRRLDFPYGYALRHFVELQNERRDIRRRQFDDQKIQERQYRELQRLLRHAYQNCPYYTRLFDQNDLRPEKITSLSDLAQVPLLSRRAFRKNFYDLCSDQFSLKHCYIKHTSGSTGEPIKIVLDYSINMLWNVLLLNFIQPYGIEWKDFRPLHTGIIFITAFPTSTSFSYFPPYLNFSRFYKLGIYPERWESPLTTLRFISARNPLIITGMPEHLLLLLQMIQSEDFEGHYPIRPRLLLSSGNKLHPSDKNRLKAYFQVPIVDIYALTEFGYLAVACHTGSGYHVDDSLILEIVRADGTPAPTGETGEIVVTSLRNFVMPLIRYRTGDFGRMARSVCACGRQWPLLQAIEGRSSEFFVKSDGTLLNPFVFMKHLDRLPVVQYQIIQQSVSEVLIKYIANEENSALDSQFSRSIYDVLGRDVIVRVERVHQIGEPGRKIQNFFSLVPNPFQT